MFVRKFNGKTERTADPSPLVACYTCPEHGEFDVKVLRDERGEAPDVIACSLMLTVDCEALGVTCELPATWTPSPTVACRVRRVEVVRGKWEAPERPTYLDTRKLGEGQSMEEFRAERKKVWERKRLEDLKRFKDGL
ncbi:MAG TPA: hypothetical protein VLT45_21030 [Kofleriaceae bacterium]|nr:hypothetical protein [Kofleriaceae bacterium]